MALERQRRTIVEAPRPEAPRVAQIKADPTRSDRVNRADTDRVVRALTSELPRPKPSRPSSSEFPNLELGDAYYLVLRELSLVYTQYLEQNKILARIAKMVGSEPDTSVERVVKKLVDQPDVELM